MTRGRTYLRLVVVVCAADERRLQSEAPLHPGLNITPACRRASGRLPRHSHGINPAPPVRRSLWQLPTPLPPLNDLAHLRLMTWTRFLLRAGKLSFV